MDEGVGKLIPFIVKLEEIMERLKAALQRLKMKKMILRRRLF